MPNFKLKSELQDETNVFLSLMNTTSGEIILIAENKDGIRSALLTFNKAGIYKEKFVRPELGLALNSDKTIVIQVY